MAVATPKVWSEHGGAHRLATGVVTDCTYSANLMVLVHGGFRDFPEGAFTAEERNALEEADDHPDHIGANHTITDVAIKRRYGVTMRQPPNAGWGRTVVAPDDAVSGGTRGLGLRSRCRLRRGHPAQQPPVERKVARFVHLRHATL